MGQVHKRFSDEQVRVLFQSYSGRKITRNDLQDLLGIEKTCFFTLLKSIETTLTKPSDPKASQAYRPPARETILPLF